MTLYSFLFIQQGQGMDKNFKLHETIKKDFFLYKIEQYFKKDAIFGKDFDLKYKNKKKKLKTYV